MQDATNFLLKLSQDLPPDQATKPAAARSPSALGSRASRTPMDGHLCVGMSARACVRAIVWRVSGG